MKDPLLPPLNSQKRNLEEKKPGFFPIFVFLKWGRYSGGQFSIENDICRLEFQIFFLTL